MVSSRPDSAPAWTQRSRHWEGSVWVSFSRLGPNARKAVFRGRFSPARGRQKWAPTRNGETPSGKTLSVWQEPQTMFSRPHTPPHCSPRPCPPPPSVSTPEFSLFRAMRVAALTFISLRVQDGKSEEEGQGGQADPHRSGCRPATGPGLGWGLLGSLAPWNLGCEPLYKRLLLRKSQDPKI